MRAEDTQLHRSPEKQDISTIAVLYPHTEHISTFIMAVIMLTFLLSTIICEMGIRVHLMCYVLHLEWQPPHKAHVTISCHLEGWTDTS